MSYFASLIKKASGEYVGRANYERSYKKDSTHDYNSQAEVAIKNLEKENIPFPDVQTKEVNEGTLYGPWKDDSYALEFVDSFGNKELFGASSLDAIKDLYLDITFNPETHLSKSPPEGQPMPVPEEPSFPLAQQDVTPSEASLAPTNAINKIASSQMLDQQLIAGLIEWLIQDDMTKDVSTLIDYLDTNNFEDCPKEIIPKALSDINNSYESQLKEYNVDPDFSEKLQDQLASTYEFVMVSLKALLPIISTASTEEERTLIEAERNRIKKEKFLKAKDNSPLSDELKNNFTRTFITATQGLDFNDLHIPERVFERIFNEEDLAKALKTIVWLARRLKSKNPPDRLKEWSIPLVDIGFIVGRGCSVSTFRTKAMGVRIQNSKDYIKRELRPKTRGPMDIHTDEAPDVHERQEYVKPEPKVHPNPIIREKMPEGWEDKGNVFYFGKRMMAIKQLEHKTNKPMFSLFVINKPFEAPLHLSDEDSLPNKEMIMELLK